MNTDFLISPAPNALPGSVTHLHSYRATDFPPGCAILCRCNAPLVSLAYGLLMRDVPCNILGKDIGTQLISLCNKMHTDDLPTFQERLQVWRNREVQKCLQDDRNPESIEDKYSCLCFFIESLDEKARTVPDLIAKIALLFDSDQPNTEKVTLSSVHKSKGLEFPVVYILDRHLIPSRYATLPWQREQERNLLYVAVTRTSDKLIYISSDSWKEETKP